MTTQTTTLDAYLARPTGETLLALLKAHQDVVYTICVNVLQNAHDAEDAAQEALLEVASGIRRLEEPRAFRSWLFRLVYRTAVDHLRKRRARDQANERGQRMIETLLPEEDRAALHDAIARLPDDERLLLVEHYFEKRTLDDLAARAGVSSVAIWKRLERVRGRLKQSLAGAGFALGAARVAEALESVKPAAAPAGLIGKSITAASLAVAGGIAVGTKSTLSSIAIVAGGLCLVLGVAGGYLVGVRRADDRADMASNATRVAENDRKTSRDRDRTKDAPATSESAASSSSTPDDRLAAPGAADKSKEDAAAAAGGSAFEAKVRAVDWNEHVRTLMKYARELEAAQAESRQPRIGPELGQALVALSAMMGDLGKALGHPPKEMMKIFEHPLVAVSWQDAVMNEIAGSPISDEQMEALRKTAIYTQGDAKPEAADRRPIDAWIEGVRENLQFVRETRGILQPEQYAHLERTVTPTFMLNVSAQYSEKSVKPETSAVGRYWLDAYKLPDAHREVAEAVAAAWLTDWTALQQTYAARSVGGVLPREAEIERRMRELELQKAAEERLAQTLPVDDATRARILKGTPNALSFEAR